MPMTKTFTENDLLGFLYGDLTKKQESEIQQALLTDHTLLQKFKALKETKDELSKVMVKAPQSSVDKILSYSRGLQPSEDC